MRAIPSAAALFLVLSAPSPASAAGQSWTDLPMVPLPSGATDGELHDVTAIAPDDAWAIGSWTDTVAHPLTVHWDGTRWTDVPVDDSAAPGHYRLAGVDGVAAGDIWAVGAIASVTPGNSDTALFLHYTAGAWQVYRSAVAGTLTGIDMVSANEGWAVGNVGTSRVTILRYQSGVWSAVPVRTPAGAQLTSVYGAPSGEAWAVGSQPRSGGGSDPLILHWDGHVWLPVAGPRTDPDARITLNRVTGTSATDVWAVGTNCTQDPLLICRSSALRWSNGAWEAVTTAGGFELTGVAATPTGVWVVGYDRDFGTVDVDHVEQWDGVTLIEDKDVLPVINSRGEMGSALTAATPDHGGGLWAVGWARPTGDRMPSALHLSYRDRRADRPLPARPGRQPAHGVA